MFHLHLVNRPFKVTLEKINDFTEPTKKYHKMYSSGDFIKSITKPSGFMRQLDAGELEDMNKYLGVEPLHRFVDGLKDTNIYEKIGDGEVKFMLMAPAERGFIFMFNYNGTEMVLKPYQNLLDEREIAKIASDGEFGPKVIGLGDDWLVEEFVYGKVLTDLYGIIPHDIIGEIAGIIYANMHESGIVYAYQPHLTRNEGPRHILVAEHGPRMIDFGIAKRSTKEEAFKKDVDEVLDYFKHALTDDDAKAAIDGFRRGLS